MERTLIDFITALRGSGVRVSISETLDAFRTAELVGYEDRKLLQDALGAALAKSLPERETFFSCFSRFFSRDDFPKTDQEFPNSGDVEIQEEDAPLTQMLLSGDLPGLSVSMSNASRRMDITAIRFFTQKSFYVRKILNQMGLESLDRDIRSLKKRDRPGSQDKAEALETARQVLFEHVRDFVEKQYDLFARSVSDDLIENYLKEIKLSNVERKDFERMRSIIQRMVKRLQDRHSRRRKRAKRGWLDFRKTLRDNSMYQGPLFHIRWKTKRMDRPDIVAICDLSRSVEAVARFMLLFLYSLNEAMARIRTFVFCSNLAEASPIFEKYGADEALERLLSGMDLPVIFGRTDYGRALREFKKGWIDTVTKKTTVLMLGDARSNFGDPGTDVMKLIHQRSKRVLWLNPEFPSFWGTGDSEMKRYLPFCHLARECNTLTHLERVVDALLTVPK